MRLLFVSLTNNAGSQRVIADMARLGFECGVLSPPGFYCQITRFANVKFTLPPHWGVWLGVLAVRKRLDRINVIWRPQIVVPLDDHTSDLLRGLVVGDGITAGLRQLLVRSLGCPSGYEAACSRAAFTRLATQTGVRTPKSLATNPKLASEAASEIGFPLLLKREHSSGGFGVSIAHDSEDLKANLKAAGFNKWGLLRLCRGNLRRGKERVRRIVWRAAGLPAIRTTAFELQQFIKGVPAMHVVAAWEGHYLEGMSLLKQTVNPAPFGSSTIVQWIENEEMAESARKLVAAMGLSGFASFDFIIEEGTGHVYVIEINARPVGAIHLGRRFGQDVCGAFARQLTGKIEKISEPVPACRRLVALFPNELERDPCGDRINVDSELDHDVPLDDRPVVEAYYRRLSRLHPRYSNALARRLGVDVSSAQDESVDIDHQAKGISLGLSNRM